jgi:rhodanese-related sulfurtransferase
MRRVGKNIYYEAADESTVRFFKDFKDFARHQFSEIRAALQEISKSPSRLHPVGQQELLQKIAEEDALIIDVRPEEEYRNGHLPGAVSIPLADLEKRIKELPWNRPILAYCRGRYCILADQAVEILLARGFNAQRAEEGMLEWKIAGMPIEKSPPD